MGLRNVSVCNVPSQESVQSTLVHAIVGARIIEELVGGRHHVCVWSLTMVVVRHFEDLVVVGVRPQVVRSSWLVDGPFSLKTVLVLIESIELAGCSAALV